jgi:hypothetical protein
LLSNINLLMLSAKAGRFYVLRANRSRVHYTSIFSRNAVTGKSFLEEKLFTFSHNSQNGNPTVTRSTRNPGLTRKPELRRRGRRSHAQLRFCFRGLVGNSGWVARQQLKIDGGKFAPAAALNGCIRVRPSICSGGHPACRSRRHPCRPTLNPHPSSSNLSQPERCN